MKQKLQIVYCWLVVAIIAISGIIAMTANAANAQRPVEDVPTAISARRLFDVMDNLLERIYTDNEDYYLDVLSESDEYEHYIEVMKMLQRY